MSITPKTRRLLWGRAAGRCSLCRMELVFEKSEFDDESIVGEECHIIAQKPGGPRGTVVDEGLDIDGYRNLILMCRNHHKLVDDQRSTYTSTYLTEMKRVHEEWVNRSLGDGNFYRRLIIPFPIYYTSTGRELLKYVPGSQFFVFENDEIENKDQADIIGSISQDIKDYIDIWGELGESDKISAQLQFNESLKILTREGFIMYATQRRQRIRNSSGEILGIFAVLYVIFFQKENSSIVDDEQSGDFRSFIFASI